ncbi:MAG: hypothetical protein Q8Q36_02285 [bacterium]|nr:hypothetical protein [bacterium]
MNRAIAVLAAFLLGGCGGMQPKEPMRPEPFVVDEILIKGESPGGGLKPEKQSEEELKFEKNRNGEQKENESGEPRPKGLAYDMPFSMRTAYVPGQAMHPEKLVLEQSKLLAIGASAMLFFSLYNENAVPRQGGAYASSKEAADRVAEQNLRAWYSRRERYKSDVYGLFYRHGPDSNLLDMKLEELKSCKTHVWVKASHSHAKPGSNLNENIWGVGLACRINAGEKHRWWWSVDTLRNSHRLTTYLVGPIYQYELFEFYGFRFLPGIHAPLTYYNMPVRRNGEPVDRVGVKKLILVPGVSIESGGPLKGITIDIGRIPIADVTVERLSIQGYFLF